MQLPASSEQPPGAWSTEIKLTVGVIELLDLIAAVEADPELERVHRQLREHFIRVAGHPGQLALGYE